MRRFKFAVNPRGINKDWNFETLATQFTDVEGTIFDVQKHVSQGHAICAGLLGGRRRNKANVRGSQWILLDVDNSTIREDENGNPLDEQGRPVELWVDGKRTPVDVSGNPIKERDRQPAKIYQHQLTLNEAIAHPFIRQYCALIYTTASHRPHWHKFRLVFLLPEFIADVDTYEAMVRLLMEQLPHDPSCKDASRVFYGSTQADFPLVNPDVALPVNWTERAIALAEQAKREQAERQRVAEKRRQELQQRAKDEGWDTDALIEQALTYIPPREVGSGNYEQSCQVLMALAAYFGPTQAEGIAERWSPSIKGTSWNIRQKIKSFRRSGITIGTLFHIAKGYGFRFPTPKRDRFGLSKVLTWFNRAKPKPVIKAKHSQRVDIEFTSGARLNAIARLQSEGVKYILDISGTGTQKSTSAGVAEPEGLGVKRLFYLAESSRKPSTIDVEQSYEPLPVRHDGMVADEHERTPSGKPVERWPQAGEKRNVKGNCTQAGLFRIFASKGIAVEGSENPICLGCPHFGVCGQQSGWFRYDRKQAIAFNTKIAANPQSLNSASEFDYSNDGIFWDEAGKLLQFKSEAILTLSDFDRTMSVLELTTPDLHAALRPLRVKLRPILAEEIKAPSRFGWNDTELMKYLEEAPTDLSQVVEQLEELYRDRTEGELSFLEDSNGIDTSAETKLIASLKGKLDRRLEKLEKLRSQIAPAAATVTAHDAQWGGMTIADTAEVIAARDEVAELSEAIATVEIDIADIEKQLKSAVAERKALKQAAKSIQRAEQSEKRHRLAEQIEKRWLVPFLKTWLRTEEDYRRASFRSNFNAITINTLNRRYSGIAKAARLNVFMDATLTQERLALMLDVAPDEIKVIRQRQKPTGNLEVIQVFNMGKCGRQRSKGLEQRLAALTNEVRSRHPDLGIIDYKAVDSNKDGYWFRDNRGSNEFKSRSALLTVGTPCPNLASLEADYILLTGARPTGEDDSQWAAFVNEQIDIEFIQAAGRLRAGLRPGESLTYYAVTDHPLPSVLNAKQVKASSITTEAADKFERFAIATRAAMERIKQQGGKVTQQAVSAATGYSQAYLSRHWKLLQTLLDLPYSVCNNSAEPVPDGIEWVLEGAIAMAATEKDRLSLIDEVFFDFLSPTHWQQVWKRLTDSTQSKLLEALAVSIPPDEMALIADFA